jgi:hypothetical protein
MAFCTGCGMAFGTRAPQPVAAPAPQPVQQSAPAPQPAPQPAPVAAASIIPQPQPVQNSAPYEGPQPKFEGAQSKTEPKQPSAMLPFGQHFKNLFQATIHPVTGPAEIAGQYEKIGNALFLAGIVVVILWMVDFTTSLTVVQWKYLDGGEVIGKIFSLFFKSMFFYAVRVFGCAGIFTLASLILKEKWSFSRLLAISSMAVAPAYIVKNLVGTYLGLIPFVRFGSLIGVAADVYFMVMLYEGMSAETKLKGNKKGFVLIICIALTGIIANYF